MGLGLLITPVLAERFGKIQMVGSTQGLSVPVLILLGFSPLFWMSAAAYYVHLTLMNMSSPIYETFVMEKVEPSSRAMVAALVSMAWSFGWTFSPSISGALQIRFGFTLPFVGTISMYIITIVLYWVIFRRNQNTNNDQDTLSQAT